MNRMVTILSLCAILTAFSTTGWCQPPISVKILPYGVDYPLVRSSYYRSLKGDPYEMSFGVRKWLNPIQNLQSDEFRNFIVESDNWLSIYGGYGVLGHGEEVFTRRAAAFRSLHRGR